ncbi:hypothetical protein RHGRI_016969 [Rhododendron griersonianum]|uniref:Uncharacterized protein n=1 Tax=Rhododendron griersonianum TaxID=479676 RepID=A0AAV6JW58_9ERIC|nr:hypothetical protein RHGRI_016969 [Rhododendron griersonianum]
MSGQSLVEFFLNKTHRFSTESGSSPPCGLISTTGFFSEDLYTEASRLVAHWTSFGAEPELVGCGHGRRLWLAGLINGQPESHRSSRLISDFKICSSHRLGFSETQNRYDPEENRMQATVFGYDIKVFESSLKLYHTYSITNPTVRLTPEMFRFLENKNQLGINARTPVEEIEIDGLTMRTMKYNFTPINSLQQIKEANPRLDVLFVILNVGPRKFINNSYVVDVRKTDQSQQPSVLSLWDHFSEYEAPAMANLPGSFPVVVHLPHETHRVSSLTLYCQRQSHYNHANTAKLRELAATEPEYLLIPKGPENPEDDTIKIANLPISVDKTQYLNVQGIARVIDFSQNFYYLACSLCKKATNAYGNGDFWLKFNIHIIDQTGTVEATVFSEVASEFYNITAADAIDVRKT